MSVTDATSRGGKLPTPRRLKNEAKLLQRQHPLLTRNEALDAVAKARDWSSYKAYERAWSAPRQKQEDPVATAEYVVTLAARWYERTEPSREFPGTRGGMRAQVRLSEPWPNFMSLAERRSIGALRRFHISQGNRSLLVAAEASTSRMNCFHTLMKAARRLVFVDVMRVLPASLTNTVKAFGGDPHKMLTTRYPNQDHDSLWYDPETGLHFILNEPYQVDHQAQDSVLSSRQMVAYTTRKWTTHNSTGTLAQLIAPAQAQESLAKLFQRSLALPARFEQITLTDDKGNSLIER